MFQLARDFFILMDSAIICIHSRKSQPQISWKITAVSLIRNKLAITLTNLLTQGLTFSSNIFYGSFNVNFAAVIACLIIIIISSSSNSSSGVSGSNSDSTSSCGSSKILTWACKYKSGVMAGTRVGKHKFRARAGSQAKGRGQENTTPVL